MSESVPISQWAERWWYILRAHRPSQLGWRAIKLAQRRLFPLLPKTRYTDVTGELLRPRNHSGFEVILERQLDLRSRHGHWQDRVEGLLRGDFCFLNETRNWGPSGDREMSAAAPVSHLWRFHWHYQEYLLDLVAAARTNSHSDAAGRISVLIDAWIQAHPLTRAGALGDAWHPFCLSRRIPVWLLVWQAGLIPEELQERFQLSLAGQIRFLEQHLEWDLRGNHLLENLKALALAGAFFEGPIAEGRLKTAEHYLVTQLDEQLLPSGEHFERSPMYHAQMLAAILDIRDATSGISTSLFDLCNGTASRMATFLRAVLHPDGQIPLLADSALDETPTPHVLIVATGESDGKSTVADELKAQQIGDYWVWRDGADYLLFDAGRVGAEELPAHAHGDLLTIEASLAGERLIVDGGVYDYADSEMRQYCRSSVAHNVLQVDQVEQCDLWSRFRMGRRGRPTPLVTCANGDFAWAGATHNAYQHMGVPVLGRWIACRPGGPWIIVDWADGNCEHTLTHWLHLTPEASLRKGSDRAIQIERAEWSGSLCYLTEGTVSLESAWYCPEFGVRHRAPVVRYETSTTRPGYVVSVLAWNESLGTVSLKPGEQGETVICWDHNSEHLQWSPKRLICDTTSIEKR